MSSKPLDPCELEARRRVARLSKKDLGIAGEDLWVRVFGLSGFQITNQARIEEDGAPKTHGLRPVILPDFFLVDPNTRQLLYAEIKGKSQAGFFRLWGTGPYEAAGGRETHCVNRFNYYEYKRIQHDQGLHVFLGIFECFKPAELAFTKRPKTEWSGQLLLKSLDRLGPPPREDTMNGERVVTWPKTSFSPIGKVSARFLLDEVHPSPEEWLRQPYRENILREFAHELRVPIQTVIPDAI